MKNVLILYTGGTIGCVGSPLAPMTGGAFEEAFRRVILPCIHTAHSHTKFDFDSFDPVLDSTNIQPPHWCEMAARLLQKHNDYDAFIVLHGTDTLAWAASALSFMLPGLSQEGLPLMPWNKPVLVTGSQMPLFKESKDGQLAQRLGTDALENLAGAIQSCDQMVAGLLPVEVGLYFARHLMRGNRATKVDTDGFSAFGSPNYALLAESSIHSFARSSSGLSAAKLQSDETLQQVLAQVKGVQTELMSGQHSAVVFPAFPVLPTLLSALVKGVLDNPDVRACIFEGFGAGNFPGQASLQAVFSKAHDEDGKILVAGTQVVGGTVASQTYAAGSWLKDCGVIGSGDMTTPAAHVKLTWLLALNQVLGRVWSQQDIEALFQRPLAGELSVSST